MDRIQFMNLRRLLPILEVFALLLSENIYTEITEEQRAMVESLPPDQRRSVLTKMETANEL